jgi:selenoprotein W-related protein
MSTGEGVKVTITYCAECGYEPQTLALADALMKAFTHQLTVIELVPWYEGSFDVAVNGQLVHSMYRDGGFPDPSTIVNAVKTQLASASATAPKV